MKRVLVGLCTVVLAAWPSSAAPAQERLPAATLDVIVVLRDPVDLQAARAPRFLARSLRAQALASQERIRTVLEARKAEGSVVRYTPLWILDGLAVTAAPGAVAELAALPEVAGIRPDRSFTAPSVASGPAVELGVALIGAPGVWAKGVQGEGALVASLDTGVDVTNPDLAAGWRGGSNSWFDPNGEHPDSPFDANGHGTATMGIITGGDSGGSAIGVAPGAIWIAAKIFDDDDVAHESDVHLAFQWLLDPDDDAGTDDAPDIVNASWTLGAPGCDLEFEPDLAALRAAGIVPVFAAGNGGPGSGTSVSPANNPSALSVGATDPTDGLWTTSSRGPSTCGGRTGVFPSLTAPGVGVRSADLFGGYRTSTGTSLAAPHVTGALALLVSGGVTPLQAEQGLLTTAVDLGPAGPDDGFGHGRIDVLAAYDELAPPPLRLISRWAVARGHRIRVGVRHSGCGPCRALARLRVHGVWRTKTLATNGDLSSGVFRHVSSGRWRYTVEVRDLDSGRTVVAAARRVRVR